MAIDQIIIGNDRINFRKNLKQREYMTAIFKDDLTLREDEFEEYAYFGAFRSAKSYSQQLACNLICMKYKNVNGLFIRDTYDQLRDSVIKQFRDDFEKWGQFEYYSQAREFRYKHTSSVIKCRAFDKDTNILSTEYDFIAVCQGEDIPEELFLQLLGRLSGKHIPKKLMLIEGNPSGGWVKRRYKDTPKVLLEKRGIKLFEGKTEDNADNLPANYIERLRENYPKSWFDRYVMGTWENLEERVLSEFVEEKHVIPKQDAKYFKNFKNRIGMDYGWINPTALVWGAIDYDGILFIYDEWGGERKTVTDIFNAWQQHGKMYCIADYSIKRPNHEGRSLWDDLGKEGMWLIESNKQEIANIQLVNTLLKSGRLYIMDNCVNLIKEIKEYKWKRLKLGEQSNHSEKPVQKDNHYTDGLFYLIASLEELRSKDIVKEEREKNTIYNATIKKEKRDFKLYG